MEILALISAIIITINFIRFLISGKQPINKKVLRICEIVSVIVVPVYLLFTQDFGQANNCCTESAVFSPDHRLSIYVLIFSCIFFYFLSTYRKTIAPPVIELLTNAFLVAGIVLNLLICIQLNARDLGSAYWLCGNVPILMQFVLVLARNQGKIIEHLRSQAGELSGWFEKFSFRILTAHPFVKYPALLLLALPIILILVQLLLMFGQKPDSLIRAFTDTYKQGFSQWDYKCDNVNCGGHYLCSVAANGHNGIVKPVRFGERNGHKIICNRQLLVSNAFEELIQERLPAFHKIIRKQYNHIGKFVHRYYNIFNTKCISDIIYFAMKPLEWFFLLMLYMSDRNPENRIAKQYLSAAAKENIVKYLRRNN